MLFICVLCTFLTSLQWRCFKHVTCGGHVWFALQGRRPINLNAGAWIVCSLFPLHCAWKHAKQMYPPCTALQQSTVKHWTVTLATSNRFQLVKQCFPGLTYFGIVLFLLPRIAQSFKRLILYRRAWSQVNKLEHFLFHGAGGKGFFSVFSTSSVCLLCLTSYVLYRVGYGFESSKGRLGWNFEKRP